MRPNTFHCVFTLEPTIVHGGHFYATSTIRESCIASYHSFVLEKVISNTSHQGASLELLRRLVTYFESVYTKDTYLSEFSATSVLQYFLILIRLLKATLHPYRHLRWSH